MATIQTFKGVVRLTKAQLNTLINTGTLSDGTTTITYDPQNTIYLTPQEQASTSDAGVILIATDQDVQTGTNTTKAVTPAQLKAVGDETKKHCAFGRTYQAVSTSFNSTEQLFSFFSGLGGEFPVLRGVSYDETNERLSFSRGGIYEVTLAITAPAQHSPINISFNYVDPSTGSKTYNFTGVPSATAIPITFLVEVSAGGYLTCELEPYTSGQTVAIGYTSIVVEEL